MKNAHDLYRQAIRATTIGLVVNLVLGIIKFIAGVISGSWGLISDAVNSCGDALTSLAVCYGLYFAQRPADAEHPYGHTRAEGIAASNIAIVIMLSAGVVAWESIQRMGQLVPRTEWWVILIASSNIAIKELLYQYKSYVGRQTGSLSLVAHAWDHRNDALCSLAVLLGLLAIRWGGSDYYWVDSLAAVVVSLGVIWSSLCLFRQSAHELMDVQANDEILQQVRELAESVPGVELIETLYVRKTGLEYLADIHIEVDAQMTVEQGHRIGHMVKDRLLNELEALKDVLVHLEPHPHRHD